MRLKEIRVGAAPFVITGLLAVLGFWSTTAVSPAGGDTSVEGFSAVRAEAHVVEIARAPHPVGSPEIERVRDYIVRQLEDLGLETDLQAFTIEDPYGSGGQVDVVNVIGWLSGTSNSRAVLLVGHYDSHPATPGANDNSAAVAALLETARALAAGPPPANDVVFLFSDAEEPAGRAGAATFAAVPGLIDRIGLVVNLETNGSAGASTVVETSGPRGWLIGEYAAAAPAPAAFSFLTDVSDMLGSIGTDFDVFYDAGVPGFHFAYLRGSPIYHTAADDLDHLGLSSLQHHGSNTLAIARHFGDLDLSEVPESGASVFFTLRPFFVQYPAWFAVLLAIGAMAGLAWAAARRPEVVSLLGIARDGGATLLAAIAGAVLGTILWVSLVAVRSSPAILEVYAYFGVILGLTAMAARWILVRTGSSEPGTRRYGHVTLWVLLGTVTALALPGTSYLFGWTAAAAVACLLWRPPGPGWATARFTAVAVPTLLLMVPAVDYLLQFANPRTGNPDSSIPMTVLVPLLLASMAVMLLTEGWHRADTDPDAA